MLIRPATLADFDDLQAIFARARQFMADTGNPNQWRTTYPAPELIRKDIAAGATRVCEVDGRIQCVFSVFPEGDPCYNEIFDGGWLDDQPYCAIHRVATRGEIPGIAARCLDWCVEEYGNIRIDTHADNAPMQHVLEKLGFARCGRVYFTPTAPRIAYHRRKI